MTSNGGKEWWWLIPMLQDLYRRLSEVERRLRKLENKRPTLSERLRRKRKDDGTH